MSHESRATLQAWPFLRATAYYAIARICYRPSVCPSHGWISQKRL